MKVSIITVCFNSMNYISDCIKSVLYQNYEDIEYIIIDGGSDDSTLEIIKSFKGIALVVSEPDSGIYNAMNKGIKLATGDIIGILNSDDFLTDEFVVQKIVDEFNRSPIDVIYGDIQFVNHKNLKKNVRYYSSKRFNPSKFKFGIMPAHPSFYTKREYFECYGYYKEDYKIAADFELLLRFLYIHKLKSIYINFPLVTMRTGGVSNKSLKSNIILNNEILRACLENGISTNIIIIYAKYFSKLFQFVSLR